MLGKLAHNVLAVTEVWAGIKGLCGAKTARPNLGEGGVGAFRRPSRMEAEALLRRCINSPVM